jgi:hypothetical protein
VGKQAVGKCQAPLFLAVLMFGAFTMAGVARAATTAQLCAGDGVKGKRFELLYVERTGDADPSTEEALAVQRDRIPAKITDLWLEVSRGTNQVPRWRCDNDTRVRLSVIDNAPTTLDSTGSVRSFLRGQSVFNKLNRKYVVLLAWLPTTGEAATADLGTRDGGPNYSILALPSWNREPLICYSDRVPDPDGKECVGSAVTVMHEMVHTMGAVNPNAPGHNPVPTSIFHTNDSRDLLAYTDDGSVTRRFCDAKSYLLDCGRDTYWDHKSTAAAIGTAREWLYRNPQFNIYKSRFLAFVG